MRCDRNSGKTRVSNMCLKTGTQIPGKEQKSSEIHPIIREKLSLYHFDVQFQPRNSDLFQSYMEICTLEIENEPGRSEITTDNQGKYIFAKFPSNAIRTHTCFICDTYTQKPNDCKQQHLKTKWKMIRVHSIYSHRSILIRSTRSRSTTLYYSYLLDIPINVSRRANGLTTNGDQYLSNLPRICFTIILSPTIRLDQSHYIDILFQTLLATQLFAHCSKGV